MEKRKVLPIMLLVIALTLSACTAAPAEPAPDATQIFQSAEQTLMAQQAETQAAAPPEEPAAPVEEAPAPTATLEPTATSSVAMASVSQDTNCRTGPGDEYEIVGYLEVGQKAEVVGVDSYGDYYIIKNPQGGEDCWLWGTYATTEGDLSNLPVVQAPPTPAPDVSWAGTWSMQIDGKTYSVVLTQESKIIYGWYKVGDVTVNFTGVVSGDNTQVNGKFTDSEDNEGQIKFVMVAGSFNQFQGEGRPTSGKAWAWCGGRNGAGLPGTCQLP